MATLEARIYQAIGPLVGDRAYPDEAPADVARPYVVHSPVATTGSYTLSTVMNRDRCLVQVDIYDDAAKPLSDFIALIQQVRRALEAAGGRMQSQGRDKESDTSLYRARMDFIFWHRPD